MAARIMYVKPNCPYCAEARAAMRAEGVEFVGPEHTARNLMIRAVRGLPVGDPAFVNEYRELKRFWDATPYLEAALGEPFQRLVAE